MVYHYSSATLSFSARVFYRKVSIKLDWKLFGIRSCQITYPFKDALYSCKRRMERERESVCARAREKSNEWTDDRTNGRWNEPRRFVVYNQRTRCEVNQFNIINWQVLRYGKVARGSITTKLKINNFETRHHHLHRIFVSFLFVANRLAWWARDAACVPNFVYVLHIQQAIKRREKKSTNGAEANECIKKYVHCFLTRAVSLSRSRSRSFCTYSS